MTVRCTLVLALAWMIWLDALPCSAGHEKWWQTGAMQDRLALTPMQIDAIERIFELTSPKRLRLQRALADLESALADAIDKGQDTRASALIPRVESARAAHNIARTMMLYRIYRILTPDQRSKLKDIRALECGASKCTASAGAEPDSLHR